MRIIENNYTGNRSNAEHDVVCPHCNSKLTYYESDIQPSYERAYIVCPCCHKDIFVTDDEPVWLCEHCGATFEGEPYIGVNGAEWVDCPRCGDRTFVSEGIEITADTVEYPKHFFSYGEGKPVDDEQINEWIKDAVNRLDKDVDYSGHASGDTIVLAYKSDEDYSSATVIVAKKYQECEVKIPKEKFKKTLDKTKN